MRTIKNYLFQMTKLVVVVAFVASVPAAFAASTWTQNLQQDCVSSNVVTQPCAGLPSVTATGWTTGGGSASSPNSGTPVPTFAPAPVYNWGAAAGLGVVSGNENSAATGPHAIDNGFGIEALMLNFTSGPVNLSNLAIGWNGTDNPCINANNGTGSCTSSVAGTVNYNDSDLSVLAWAGAPGTKPTMAGSGLLSAGWNLVGNYANVGASNGATAGGTAAINSSIYSSYWLISAYSVAYGVGTNLDQGNDSFKVLSVSGNTCNGTLSGTTCNKTPEPGSLALLGAALVGFVATRRRKQATI
jgi:hypothetical protein